MRTAVYVDGFNLFHRLLEGNSDVKWLDLWALARACLRADNDVTQIRYFTARVPGNEADPGQHTRQDIYLQALEATNVYIHLGVFRRRRRRLAMVNPPERDNGTYVEVWHREEKRSDVNLAVHMLHDAWLDVYDCAVVLSNDSDLVEALRLVRSMGKVVGILCPAHSGPAIDLVEHSDFVRQIRGTQLLRSQLPTSVSLANGREVHCPPGWRSAPTDHWLAVDDNAA